MVGLDYEGKHEAPEYCTQPGVTCDECSLSNYRRDCMNNPIGRIRGDEPVTDEIERAKELTIRETVKEYLRSDEGRSYIREIIKEIRNR